MTTSTAQLHQVTSRATSFKMLRLGIMRPVASSTLVAILSLSQLAHCASTSSLSGSSLANLSLSDNSAPPAIPDETPANELHFGAKVALCLLTATIALVAVATLVDYQTNDEEKDTRPAAPPSHRKRTGPKSRDHTPNGHRLLAFGKREPSGGLRDYRSLSMSSSCSSSLFCYTNSVASSSVTQLGQPSGVMGNTSQSPLATAHHHRQVDTLAQVAQASQECLDAAAAATHQQQHYELNLQLHVNHHHQHQEQAATNNVNNACGKPLTLNLTPSAPSMPFCVEENNKMHAPATYHHQSECSIESPSSREQLVMGERQRRRRAELAALAGQILLAFSLRQSARQIFGSSSSRSRRRRRPDAGEEARRCATSDKWPTPDNAAPTLTFLSEQNNSHKISCDVRQEAARANAAAKTANIDKRRAASIKVAASTATTKADTTSGPHESIDSLHGLRFLSMIWVIVIHSYNFALRWMFFSNATTLDSIYKSAASQLIANGSFACDSFFFAGGFLLPYSAFVADTSTAPAQSQEEAQNEEEEEEVKTSETATTKRASTHVTPTTSINERAHVRGDHQQVASPAAVSERLESGSWCCSSYCSCPCVCGCCCCCYCCYCAQQQLHGCRRVGLVDAGAASQDHARVAATAISDNISTSRLVELTTHPCQAEQLVSGGPHAHQRPICVHCSAQQHHQQHPASFQQTAEREQNINELTTTRGANDKFVPNHVHPTGASRDRRQQQPLTLKRIVANILHRYARMMPLMMAIIGLCANLLRYLGDGPLWADSTLMYDGWCRKNWWINAMFLHNFVNRENMCLSHSWYSAVDLQLFLVGQLVLFVLSRSRRAGLALLLLLIGCSQVITMSLTLAHQLPAVPLVSSVDERTMNLYYGEIYIKPYCRASPYLIGILLAYLMRTTQLERLHLHKWQVATGWTLSLGAFAAIILAMQPAMNGHSLSGLESALYSALSRPLWALATGWMIFACITNRGGLVARLLGARCFVPLSKLTYPAFLVHPIVMALFYGSRQSSFHFSHYLMLYLILGNIVITYASAFILATLFELPMLSVERAISRRLFGSPAARQQAQHS